MFRLRLHVPFGRPPLFDSERDENKFRRHYIATGLRRARVASVIAGLVVLVFWVLIGFFIEDKTTSSQRQWLRMLLVMILFVCAVIIHCYPRFSIKNYIFVVGIPAAVVCVTIGLMSLLPQDVENHTTTRFPTAMVVACWLMYGFTRLPVRFVSSVCVISSSLMIGGAYLDRDEYLLALLLYLVMANVVGWAMAVGEERRERILYSSRQKLAEFTRQLAKSASENAAASDFKGRVLAATSHDLRQPLTSIALYLDSLEFHCGKTNEPQIRSLLCGLKSCVSIMSESIDRLSNASSIREGDFRLAIEMLDARRICNRLLGVFSGPAEKMGVKLSIGVRQGRCVFVESDEMRLWDVLSNLVGNALKYSDRTKNSWIILGVVSFERHVRFSVVDNGIGIDTKFYKYLFDEYFQIDTLGQNKDKGYGLGLSIVRRTLDRLPGHYLRFRSEIGRGSRFDVYVPRGCTETRRPISVERLEVLDVTGAAGGGGDSKALAGCYALVIVDDYSMRSALVAAMEGGDMLVEMAGSAKEALAIVDRVERIFDVIVADFWLPDAANGIKAIEAVRDKQVQRSPGIILSSRADVVDPGVAVEIDIRVLTKPVEDGRLRREIADAIGGTSGRLGS